MSSALSDAERVAQIRKRAVERKSVQLGVRSSPEQRYESAWLPLIERAASEGRDRVVVPSEFVDVGEVAVQRCIDTLTAHGFCATASWRGKDPDGEKYADVVVLLD
ncbi:MAG: hypothetical protein V1826_02740 [bacterium]